MDRDKLREGYSRWLASFDWQWFITLTFRGYPPATKARRLLGQWLAELKRDNGTADFGYFFVLERGASGENCHFHGFVLGLVDPSDRLTWLRRWFELGGEARIEHFEKTGNATRYSIKTLRPGIDDQIVFDLPGASRDPCAAALESVKPMKDKEADG